MTSPIEPADRPGPAERGIGGGRNRPRPPAPAPRTPGRGLVLVALLGAVALVIAGAALFIALTRQQATPPTAAEASCRTVAWDAMPTTDAMPEGWTMNGSGFYTDGFGASFTGPVPSGAQMAPGMNVRVSCYGTDGHAAVTRSHDSDLALGGTDVPFSDVGDEVLAAKDANGAITSVYIRRGPLVASIAAQGMSPADLEAVAGAIDDAMLEAGATAASSAPPEPIPTDDPNASEVIEPEPTDAHVFPDLEALLPKTVDGNPLSTQSIMGNEALAGDPTSDALFQWLTASGKKPEDLEFAEAYDATSTVDAGIIALRVKGIAAADLRQKLLETWLQAEASGITTTNQTIGGKATIVIDYGDGGSLDYVFEQGDAVLILSSSDPALVARILASLQ
ncbi:MAG: hypothetical protein M3P84_01150 [Chloroflexota bacterium]|nr:hypothetical protein [Chloroflexota bacterium]